MRLHTADRQRPGRCFLMRLERCRPSPGSGRMCGMADRGTQTRGWGNLWSRNLFSRSRCGNLRTALLALPQPRNSRCCCSTCQVVRNPSDVPSRGFSLRRAVLASERASLHPSSPEAANPSTSGYRTIPSPSRRQIQLPYPHPHRVSRWPSSTSSRFVCPPSARSARLLPRAGVPVQPTPPSCLPLSCSGLASHSPKV